MKFFNTYLGFFAVLFVVIILGYFLGLMISNTVERNLKNMLINLPVIKQKPHRKIVEASQPDKQLDGFDYDGGNFGSF